MIDSYCKIDQIVNTYGHSTQKNQFEDLMRSLEGAANHQNARIEAGPGNPPDYSEGDEQSRTRVLARRESSRRG